MRADELFKVGLKDVKKGPEFKNHVKPNVSADFKIPYIPKIEIDMEPVNKNFDPNPIPNTPENGSKSFPWEVIVLFGIGLLGTYLFLQIPPDENYRRRHR